VRPALPWLGAIAVALLTLLAPATLAQALPSPSAGSCPGVWVVVAGQGSRCATDHPTGRAALADAGFEVVERMPGMVCRIGGQPAQCRTTATAYWSYWQADRNADGSWGPWRYAALGYASTTPEAGAAEGWSFGDGGTPPPAPPPDAGAAVSDAGGAASTAGTPAASAPIGATASTGGSPAGLLATLGFLVVGGGALGGWWLLKGRLR